MVQLDPPDAAAAAEAAGRAAAGPGDRRAEILRRAAAVFRTKGFHGAGMREIAAGLGMAPGALYYYFRSKEELLYACQDISLTRLIRNGRAILALPGPADERLRALIAAHLDLTLDELGGSAAHVEFHALPPKRLARIVKKRDAYEGLLRSLLREGIAAGVFRRTDVKLTALALLGALNWSVVWWKPQGRWSSTDLVEGFADVFVDGLRLPPAVARVHEPRAEARTDRPAEEGR